jgi:cytochrome c
VGGVHAAAPGPSAARGPAYGRRLGDPTPIIAYIFRDLVAERMAVGMESNRNRGRAALANSRARRAAFLFLLAGSPVSAQDGAKGKAAFARCSVCHSFNGAGGKLGPDLTAVVGRTSGSVPGYAYSPAMKAAKIKWTPDALQAFLAGPQKMVRGTKMAFPGMADAQQRAAIVAYLKTGSAK